MTATCRSCFSQLRQLRAIRSSWTTDAAKTLAQAFVGGRLVFCNSLLYGVSDDLLPRLQSVQNAAARFITGARKYDHISPVLRDLHWLPLRQMIIFKIATLMHQYLNGLVPPYLATDCIAISSIPGRRQLYDLQHQESCTIQEPRLRHSDQGRSRSLVSQSGVICLPD